jgi:hypothetical protein
VSMPIEDQRAPVGVERHFQHARFRTVQAGVGKAVPIPIKAAHRFPPVQLTDAALGLRAPPTLLVAADEVIE